MTNCRGTLALLLVAATLAGCGAATGDNGGTDGGTDQPWRPKPGTTWQWQITGDVRAPFHQVDMYDIDLEDAVPSARTRKIPGYGAVRWPTGQNAGVVDQLHDAGIIVICYLDTGAYESYRPDAHLFPKDVIGNSSGWENENWLDLRRTSWHKFAPIMWSRLRLAAEIGCDGVEPDENNPLGNDPGFPIAAADEKAWYLEVARQAHRLGLSVGMKNGLEVTDEDTVAAFDWALNEECFYYDECDKQAAFVTAGKALFQTEYVSDWKSKGADTLPKVADKVCDDARKRQFSTLVKGTVPDNSFVAC